MKPKRTLTLGDQHGALKAVKQVLEKCKFNPKEDLLINLGDVVDGWGESSQLVQFYIELIDKCTFKPIFLKGNHDAYCQKWIQGGIPNMNWLMQGGKSTIESYIDTGFIEEKSHLEFFNNMRDFYIDEENRGFVHAGFTSDKGLGFEEDSETYYWDRSLWTLAYKELDSENQIFKVHKEVFIGHTPTLNFEETTPMKKSNIWNIDTGSAYTGCITILDVNTKEYWQSDVVMELYPDDVGRNM